MPFIQKYVMDAEEYQEYLDGEYEFEEYTEYYSPDDVYLGTTNGVGTPAEGIPQGTNPVGSSSEQEMTFNGRIYCRYGRFYTLHPYYGKGYVHMNYNRTSGVNPILDNRCRLGTMSKDVTLKKFVLSWISWATLSAFEFDVLIYKLPHLEGSTVDNAVLIDTISYSGAQVSQASYLIEKNISAMVEKDDHILVYVNQKLPTDTATRYLMNSELKIIYS